MIARTRDGEIDCLDEMHSHSGSVMLFLEAGSKSPHRVDALMSERCSLTAAGLMADER